MLIWAFASLALSGQTNHVSESQCIFSSLQDGFAERPIDDERKNGILLSSILVLLLKDRSSGS